MYLRRMAFFFRSESEEGMKRLGQIKICRLAGEVPFAECTGKLIAGFTKDGAEIYLCKKKTDGPCRASYLIDIFDIDKKEE